MLSSEPDCAKCGAVLTQYIPKVSCGNSCSQCARYSYFADQSAYLYLLTHQQLKLHKIGIGTVGKDKNRMQQLIQEGWIVHGLWHEGSKRKTFLWEQEIFKQLKVKFSSFESHVPGLMGRSDRNWSESVSAEAISVSEIVKLISLIVAPRVGR